MIVPIGSVATCLTTTPCSSDFQYLVGRLRRANVVDGVERPRRYSDALADGDHLECPRRCGRGCIRLRRVVAGRDRRNRPGTAGATAERGIADESRPKRRRVDHGALGVELGRLGEYRHIIDDLMFVDLHGHPPRSARPGTAAGGRDALPDGRHLGDLATRLRVLVDVSGCWPRRANGDAVSGRASRLRRGGACNRDCSRRQPENASD